MIGEVISVALVLLSPFGGAAADARFSDYLDEIREPRIRRLWLIAIDDPERLPCPASQPRLIETPYPAPLDVLPAPSLPLGVTCEDIREGALRRWAEAAAPEWHDIPHAAFGWLGDKHDRLLIALIAEALSAADH